MNFLNQKTTWTTLQLGLIKICVGSIGIAIGSYFADFFNQYLFYLIAIYLIIGIYLGFVWIRQMKKK